MNWQLFVEGFVTLFVIMDPPGTIPLFLALTANLRPAERRRAAWQAVAVSFAVIALYIYSLIRAERRSGTVELLAPVAEGQTPTGSV